MQAATERTTITEAEFIEQVWMNLTRMLQADHDLQLAHLARLTPYSQETLKKFRSRERLSLRVAMTLAKVLPQLMDGMRCPACRRLPDIVPR